MSHMVIFQTPDGNPGYNQFEKISEAVAFIEVLRNEQRVTNARMFALEEVKFEFKPYYRVEMLELDAPAASPEAPVTAAASPTPAPASAPAVAASSPEPAAPVAATVPHVAPIHADNGAVSNPTPVGATAHVGETPEVPEPHVAQPVAQEEAAEPVAAGEARSFGDPVSAPEPSRFAPPPLANSQTSHEPPVRRGLFGR